MIARHMSKTSFLFAARCGSLLRRSASWSGAAVGGTCADAALIAAMAMTPKRTFLNCITRLLRAARGAPACLFTSWPREIRLPVFLAARDHERMNIRCLLVGEPVAEAFHPFVLELAAENDVVELGMALGRKEAQVLDATDGILPMADRAVL